MEITAMLRSSLLMALLFAAGAAQAQGVLTEKNISLDLANRLAAETVKQCSAKGYNVSAAVVDRAGVLRALQRADQAGPHTVNASIDKAYTSASARSLTSAMLEGSQKNAGAANLGDIQGFLLLGGGVPVKVGNDTIGAIGVGGAPGGHLDEACAVAALETLKADLK
ncbi:GlcG/HbpS family heme-binding protein [Alcaligenes faecalis]|uniref:GlcG/HbpS family heme-binding protein n=2 Tax=Alcaligenes faecalis TaxID=511 RepID=UPI001556A881|nr:heme-binding protein [Alcaligenes faecalis]